MRAWFDVQDCHHLPGSMFRTGVVRTSSLATVHDTLRATGNTTTLREYKIRSTDSVRKKTFEQNVNCHRRLFVKPRGHSWVGSRQSCSSMDGIPTSPFNNEGCLSTDNSDEHSESLSLRTKIKRSTVGEANSSGLEHRVFRLEDNFAQVTRVRCEMLQRCSALLTIAPTY